MTQMRPARLLLGALVFGSSMVLVPNVQGTDRYEIEVPE